MISDAGIAQQRWLAPARARGQATIACISGLTPRVVNKLRFLRGGESYSNVILRLTAQD